MKRLSVLAGLATVACASVALAGDDAHARAARSFQEAKAALARRDFTAAAAAFELAAELELRPEPLLNAADAWVLAGDPARAAQDCDRTLAIPALGDPFRAYADERLAAITPKIGTLEVRGPATAAVRIDEGTEGHVPLRRRLAAGHHVLAIADATTGRHEQREISVAAGETLPVDLSVAPAGQPPSSSRPVGPPPPEPPRATETSPRHVSPWTWGALGTGAAAAGVAIAFGALTLSDRDAFNATPTATTRDAFYRDRTITNVAWAIGGVAAAAGVGLLVLGLTRSSSAEVALSPCGVAVRRTF